MYSKQTWNKMIQKQFPLFASILFDGIFHSYKETAINTIELNMTERVCTFKMHFNSPHFRTSKI